MLLKRNLYKKPKPKIKFKRKAPRADQGLLKDWSKKIRTRDEFTCLSCGSKKNSHAHHMVSKFYVPEYTLFLENGITLCKSCHMGPQGVHGSKNPKNKLIAELREIFSTSDIKRALKLLDRIKTL